MINRPFIPLTAALILGICTGYYLHLSDIITLVCLVFSLTILLFLSNDILWKHLQHFIGRTNGHHGSPFLQKIIKKLAGRSGLTFFILSLSLFLIGILDINLYLYPKPGPEHIIYNIDKKSILMEGIIVESPQFSPDKMDLIISSTGIIKNGISVPVNGRVLVAVKGHYPFRYGDYIRFPVRLKRPHNFQNPGGFDYKQYLLYRRILVRGFVNDPEKIIVMRQNMGKPFRTFIEKFRTNLKTVIYENAESPQREVIQAMILGNQNEIPRNIREKFNKTGVSHIIAISGFNVGIIAVFSLFTIRLIMKSSERFLLRYNLITLSTLIALIPVIIFCFIAGMGISVVRATIMVAVFMAAILIGRQRDLYNTLSLAAFIILMVAPYSLFDVSFQLSFAAVFAILFITPRLSRLLLFPRVEEIMQQYPRVSKIISTPVIFILVTLSATLGTWPLIIFYFNRFSNIALPANIIVVPILGILAIPVSMAIIITAPLSASLSVPFIYASSLLVKMSLIIVDFFEAIPGASWIATTPSLITIAAYYVLLFAVVELIDRKDPEAKHRYKKRLICLKALCAFLIVFFVGYALYLHISPGLNRDLSMTAIDVGQGTSIFFSLPGGKTLLIDGGGFPDSSFDIGQNVVAPFLLNRRIKKIDYVVLTHPHPDHLGGLIYLLENFNIGEVWTSGQPSATPLYQDFLNTIKKHETTHRILSKDTGPFSIDRITFEILHPKHPLDTRTDMSEMYHLFNDHSLVFKIIFGQTGFLITGDITSKTEQELIDSITDLTSTVLIVPHHGGFKSSTTSFLRRVQPRIAVVSCGKDNIYNVPHPDVLRRLNEMNARILRTDRDGAVTIKTDGSNLTIETFYAE